MGSDDFKRTGIRTRISCKRQNGNIGCKPSMIVENTPAVMIELYSSRLTVWSRQSR